MSPHVVHIMKWFCLLFSLGNDLINNTKHKFLVSNLKSFILMSVYLASGKSLESFEFSFHIRWKAQSNNSHISNSISHTHTKHETFQWWKLKTKCLSWHQFIFIQRYCTIFSKNIEHMTTINNWNLFNLFHSFISLLMNVSLVQFISEPKLNSFSNVNLH